MKINDLINPVYLHGSSVLLPIGTILKNNPENYQNTWGHNHFYIALEKYRPDNMISHRQAVFMADEESIDLAGGSLDYIFIVKPRGKVQKHDLNWSSEIEVLISEGLDIDSQEVKNACQKYWNGEPHHNESVWEYLCLSAEIIDIE